MLQSPPFHVKLRTSIPKPNGGYTILDKNIVLPFAPQLNLIYGTDRAKVYALNVEYDTSSDEFLLVGRVKDMTQFKDYDEAIANFDSAGWEENEELSK